MTHPIPDYQVEAALREYVRLTHSKPQALEADIRHPQNMADMRKILEAAQEAKPPEPEIEVTEEMQNAAMTLYKLDGGKYLVAPMFAKYYRAMASLDPTRQKEEGRAGPCGPEVSDRAVNAFMRASYYRSGDRQ